MQTLLFNPCPVVLTESQTKREPTRPPHLQPAEFTGEFDHDTLLFDSFFCGPTEVLITAPPFFNLLPALQNMRVIAEPSGRACSFRIRNLDRHSQIRIAVPAGTAKLMLASDIGTFSLEPRQNLSEFFADRRVIFTLSKNNRVEWIQDWIRYNRDVHGANAVLIYDNQSTDYSARELLIALSEISGIDRLCVAEWPFRYGPQGLAHNRHWDSDFCQFGVWEHSRWMFLAQARSAMNSDIDELVVAKDGMSVFEAAERSRSGIVRYRGYWVHGFQDLTRIAGDRSPIRVTDFDHYLRDATVWRGGIIPVRDWETVCPPKWTVVPRCCPDRAQWAPHRIKGWAAAVPLSRNFSFRHYREIGNHWKYDRSARERFDNRRYAYDHAIVANFAVVKWHAGAANPGDDSHVGVPVPGRFATPIAPRKTPSLATAPQKIIVGKASRFLARNVATKRLAMRNTKPIISFTFDDVPASACITGVQIIEQYGVRGTFFIAGAGFGRESPVGVLATPEQLRPIWLRGHEIGCQTHHHAAVSRLSGEELQREYARNQEALKKIDARVTVRNFAYPYGDLSFGARRKLEALYDCCRTTDDGINSDVANLGALKSCPLENAALDRSKIAELIAETVRVNGWLIFLSHDVSERPSRYGIDPGLLEWTVKAAKQSGAMVAPIADALKHAAGTVINGHGNDLDFAVGS